MDANENRELTQIKTKKTIQPQMYADKWLGSDATRGACLPAAAGRGRL
jgi:hypothetical protein